MLEMLAYTMLFILGAAALPGLPSPYAHFASLAHVNENSRTVDLGYERYRGWYNESADLVVFKGSVRSRLNCPYIGKRVSRKQSNMCHSIRYAQSTAGKLRWQAPRVPETKSDSLIHANNWPAQCPQSPGASSSYNPEDNYGSSEDCLFLNVRTR
jgi:hypothetical protein